jgi:hypothetical protein
MVKGVEQGKKPKKEKKGAFCPLPSMPLFTAMGPSLRFPGDDVRLYLIPRSLQILDHSIYIEGNGITETYIRNREDGRLLPFHKAGAKLLQAVYKCLSGLDSNIR